MKADSADDIAAVKKEIEKIMPKATVTTSADLASQVSGSLSSASTLADRLGKWLAVAALIASFAVASLLTVSAVSRRVREFGTLKALGWKGRRDRRPGARRVHGAGRRSAPSSASPSASSAPG